MFTRIIQIFIGQRINDHFDDEREVQDENNNHPTYIIDQNNNLILQH